MIREQLSARPGEPQSVTQLSEAIPQATSASIAATCILMRMQGILGRNGPGTAERPYCFYLKRPEQVASQQSGSARGG